MCMANVQILTRFSSSEQVHNSVLFFFVIIVLKIVVVFSYRSVNLIVKQYIVRTQMVADRIDH